MYFCRICKQVQPQLYCEEGHTCETVDQIFELKVTSTCGICGTKLVRRIDWVKTTYPVKQKMYCSICNDNRVFHNEVTQWNRKLDEIGFLEEQMMAEIDEWKADHLKRKRIRKA